MRPLENIQPRRLIDKLIKALETARLRIRLLYKTYFWKRSKALKKVQRFLGSWLAIMLLSSAVLAYQFNDLNDYYLTRRPSSGGTFVEGVVGRIGSLNPIFPTNAATATANKLIFSGLTKYNGRGEIIGDLAESWEINTDSSEYVIHLREQISWHDGEPITSDDVVFTFQTIKNPEVGSPLAPNWRGVDIEAIDPQTIKFKLPSPHSPFLNTLTVSLLPAHLLGLVQPTELRVVDFNQRPVGSGPFRYDNFLPDRSELQLKAFNDYAHGRPKISRFVLKAFSDQKQLAEAFANRTITGAGGLDVAEVNSLKIGSRDRLNRWILSSQVFLFFNQRRELLTDISLRQALVAATDQHELVWRLKNQIEIARSPLLKDRLGYDSEILQNPYDPVKAESLLEAASWKKAADGLRAKAGKSLRFELLSQNSDIYPRVAEEIKERWQKIGVKIDIKLADSDQLASDLERRQFDILLLGVTLGADPDVYSYWHSSQLNPPGLNLSGYKSVTADSALDDGRTRQDPKVRAAKYRLFLSAWTQDAPAMALYRPYYFYATKGARGIASEELIEPTDRFHDVHNWSLNTKTELKRLQ